MVSPNFSIQVERIEHLDSGQGPFTHDHTLTSAIFDDSDLYGKTCFRQRFQGPSKLTGPIGRFFQTAWQAHGLMGGGIVPTPLTEGWLFGVVSGTDLTPFFTNHSLALLDLLGFGWVSYQADVFLVEDGQVAFDASCAKRLDTRGFVETFVPTHDDQAMAWAHTMVQTWERNQKLRFEMMLELGLAA